MTKTDNEVDLANVVINSNSGAIDRWACKKCRKNIILELLIMLGVPIGGIFGYGYALFGILLYFKQPFYISFEHPAIWLGLVFFALWFLSCRKAFSYVDDLTFNNSWEHDKSHNELQNYTGVKQ